MDEDRMTEIDALESAGMHPPGRGEAEPPATPRSTEAEVRAAVERLLVAVGNYDLDALAPMLAPGASIAGVVLRDGGWVGASYPFEAWWARVAAGPREPYVETASHFTVYVDDDRLAFVRAEATLVQDGRTRSHNTDYFTLIRDDAGEWKFVNCSYTAKPADAPRQASGG